jgi:hypothetical protein
MSTQINCPFYDVLKYSPFGSQNYLYFKLSLAPGFPEGRVKVLSAS